MATKARNVHRIEFGRGLGYWGTGFGKLKPASWHVLDLRNAPPGDIEFELSNNAVRDGYHFNTKDPIWVDIDNGNCPARGTAHPDIDDVRVTANRVTVANRKKSGPIKLRYRLNILDRDNQSDPIDPIIEN